MKEIVQPVKKERASAVIRALLEEIQDTLGIPWPPANWRAYAHYPEAMGYLWDEVKPAVVTYAFLDMSLEIADRAVRDTGEWYRSTAGLDLPDDDRLVIRRELDAFLYGNPQLLIQQMAMSKSLEGSTVGWAGRLEQRRPPGLYRHPEIGMIEEQQASPRIRQIYEDIKQTLQLPVVNSDYQALAKWPNFLSAEWNEAKSWLNREEYHRLRNEIISMAEEAALRLCPEVRIDPIELREASGGESGFREIRRMIRMFTDLLPGLIVNNAVFRMSIVPGQLYRVAEFETVGGRT